LPAGYAGVANILFFVAKDLSQSKLTTMSGSGACCFSGGGRPPGWTFGTGCLASGGTALSRTAAMSGRMGLPFQSRMRCSAMSFAL
jgi:hypothetical protein